MSSTVADVYAKLKNLYGDKFEVSLTIPPNYLQSIVGTQESGEKIIFFYLEHKPDKEHAINFLTPAKLNLTNFKDEINLTGSPLKDDCMVDIIDDLSLNIKFEALNLWSNDEQKQKGISCDAARNILSSEEFQNAIKSGDKTIQGATVWILCNAADEAKTLLLQYKYSTHVWQRGIMTFQGVVATENVNTANLLKMHYVQLKPGTSLDTYIENTYHIKPYIKLCCAWSTSALQPALINVNYCDVTLNQTFVLKDCGTLTQDLLNQLRILILIRNDILAHKEAERLNDDSGKEVMYRCCSVRILEIDELRKNINDILTEITGCAEMDVNCNTLDYDIENVLVRAKFRQLTDLTDSLWDILKCCSSYKDLKIAFGILFQCAMRCNIVNMPRNKTRVAEFITELANKRLAVPCLTGTEPLELLLEIGLQKLYNDYEYIFTESKICSSNTLKNKCTFKEAQKGENIIPDVRKSLRNAIQQITTDGNPLNTARKTLLHRTTGKFKENILNDITFRNSNFDEEQTASMLANLLQIHCALEHLLMMQINLNIDQQCYTDICAQLLQKPARIVDTLDENFTDTIDVNLVELKMHQYLEKILPFARRITMTSKNKFKEQTTIFYYNFENICPPAVSKNFQIDDEKEMKQDNYYYSWLQREIKTLK